MDVTLVCGERRVIEAPVSEIISGGVAVPVSDREIERDLHPMPLRLVVAEPRRSAGAGVRVERHRHPHQNREQRYAEEHSADALIGQPPPSIVRHDFRFRFPFPLLLHLRFQDPTAVSNRDQNRQSGRIRIREGCTLCPSTISKCTIQSFNSSEQPASATRW